MGKGDGSVLIIAERIIQTAILDSLTLFRQNLSTFVPDVFAQETSEHQTEITNWWQDVNNSVPVVIGYTLQPIQGAEIAITNEPANEVATRRFIGSLIQQTSDNYEYGTTLQAAYNLNVLGINQNWLLWGQALVRWALFMQRTNLEQQGLLNQMISLSPLRPAPDSLKDSVFPYQRTVTLNCQHIDTWTPLPVASVSTASVTLNVES